jgi:SAM-dependent methyltransferase
MGPDRVDMTAIPSPNIWNDPDIYEIENRGVDPDGAIDAAMRSVRDWAGATVLDIGCGTGFHLPRFAATASRVVGIEPHGPLAQRARDRVSMAGPDAGAAARGAGRGRMAVLQGGAQALPLADHSVEVAHARWAYFFGAGCEPGLAELERVLAPGGVAFIIDNDSSRSTFGEWFRRAYPAYDGPAVRRFWLRRGWTPIDVSIRWSFASREQFAAVVGIEFPPGMAAAILAQDDAATGCDYAVTVWWHRF